jgi:hypothetical protein
MWNKWKVERAAVLAKKILRAPAAVNLTLADDNGILFQKSFAHNSNGNYYIINHFDITPHVDKANRLKLTIVVNGQKVVPVDVHRFKTFNIIHCAGSEPGIYFVFTTRDCEMEEFIHLIHSLPAIINSLKTQNPAARRTASRAAKGRLP